VIKEGIAIVSSENAGSVNEKQKHFLDMARKNADKLNRLLSNNFKFRGLTAGEIEINLKKNDINEIIKKIQTEILPLAKEKGINFVVNLDKTISPEAVFDGELIKEVFLNIITNAINFTKKGKITVTTSFEAPDIKVVVKDTGIGIKKKDLPYIFDPRKLIKLNNEVCLGLAISKEIIQKHNGKIQIESTPGKGTTVSLTLPTN